MPRKKAAKIANCIARTDEHSRRITPVLTPDSVPDLRWGRLHGQPFQTSVGIGDVERPAILGEIGDIHPFRVGLALVAYGSINPVVFPTGDFLARSTRMSKRGSHYLRRAIWQAAQVAARDDSALKPYYEEKRRGGKHHFAVVEAVANKLVHIIYAILRDNKPYFPL